MKQDAQSNETGAAQVAPERSPAKNPDAAFRISRHFPSQGREEGKVVASGLTREIANGLVDLLGRELPDYLYCAEPMPSPEGTAPEPASTPLASVLDCALQIGRAEASEEEIGTLVLLALAHAFARAGLAPNIRSREDLVGEATWHPSGPLPFHLEETAGDWASDVFYRDFGDLVQLLSHQS